MSISGTDSGTFIGWFSNWFSGITQGINNAAQNIIASIGDILKSLFIPDTNTINTKIASIKDKFTFADEFKTMIGNIQTYLLDKNYQIPVIRIDLGNAEGKYNYGNGAYILDMTWYSKYKPTIDKIIIAFSYIGFIFLVFKRLPDIIAGTGAITDKGEDVERGYRISFGRRNDNDN